MKGQLATTWKRDEQRESEIENSIVTGLDEETVGFFRRNILKSLFLVFELIINSFLHYLNSWLPCKQTSSLSQHSSNGTSVALPKHDLLSRPQRIKTLNAWKLERKVTEEDRSTCRKLSWVYIGVRNGYIILSTSAIRPYTATSRLTVQNCEGKLNRIVIY